MKKLLILFLLIIVIACKEDSDKPFEGCIVSILTFFGIFIILLTKKNQGLHNFISRTLVIKV